MNSLDRQRVADLLIAWRFPLLLVAVAAGTLALPASIGLEFDRSVENMFATDDPLLDPYQKLKRIFGGNEVVAAVYVDDELFARDGDGIERLSALRERLEAVPGVRYALSIDQPMGRAVLDETNPLARAARELFEGYTHGADGRTVAVVCILAPEADRAETLRQMRQIMANMPSGMIAGEPVMIADGFRSVEEDGWRLGWATNLLLAVVILAFFRSIRWVVLPIAVVQFAVLLTKAALAWSDLPLTMVSSMLTAIVTVIGIASVVHVTVRFREGRLDGLGPRESLSRAGGLLAAPIFWAVATDAVGFLALVLARVGPIQDFGLMMAIGAAMVLVAMALLVPGLVLLGRFDMDPKRAWGERLLDLQLDRLCGWARRRPLVIAASTLAVVAVCVAGTSRLDVETDFTRNFRAGSPIVRSYDYVEAHLGGAGVWDVILPAPKSLTWPFLQRVAALEERLRDEVVVRDPDGTRRPGLTKVLSLADAVIAGSPMDLGRVRFAALRRSILRTGILKLKRQMPGLVESLHGEDPSEPGRFYARIMLRAKESQPARQKQQIIEQVRQIAQKEFPSGQDSAGAEVGGLFVLFTHLIDSILRDQWFTFGVATAGIGLMMCVALRSPVLAAVALIPNVLPILIVNGMMGWLGLKINMGAAMIAAVSIGLSIDSSIHYLTGFRRARGDGKSLDEAISTVQQSVGRAVVFSTVALIVGFLVLSTSQFVPTIYFGVLVSLTMLGGLAGNLIVLPMLLRLVTRDPAGRQQTNAEPRERADGDAW